MVRVAQLVNTLKITELHPSNGEWIVYDLYCNQGVGCPQALHIRGMRDRVTQDTPPRCFPSIPPPSPTPQALHSHDPWAEVTAETVGFMTLHLSVLHHGATQRLLQVLHEAARHALGLCIRLLSDPVVQVLGCPLRVL